MLALDLKLLVDALDQLVCCDLRSHPWREGVHSPARYFLAASK